VQKSLIHLQLSIAFNGIFVVLKKKVVGLVVDLKCENSLIGAKTIYWGIFIFDLLVGVLLLLVCVFNERPR
jgi:hypothetical protein